MTPYTVIWRPRAEEQLAALWLDATDRLALRRAVAEADRLLARDPTHCGESRSGSRRIMIEPPLVLSFTVDEDDLLVRVLDVRTLPPPRRGG